MRREMKPFRLHRELYKIELSVSRKNIVNLHNFLNRRDLRYSISYFDGDGVEDAAASLAGIV